MYEDESPCRHVDVCRFLLHLLVFGTDRGDQLLGLVQVGQYAVHSGPVSAIVYSKVRVCVSRYDSDHGSGSARLASGLSGRWCSSSGSEQLWLCRCR